MNHTRQFQTMDGNEAAASVAYRLSEVVAIYPITPSSPMGEWADQWSAENKPNLWGTVPSVTEMQSEGGAAGAIHGALQTGALATTFTASQGLLLMIPNMYKIAGELTPTVFHVSARTLATHALSIFGDQSDVMAARGTGFAMLASGSVQEVMDHATIAHAATYRCRIPFLHFFDGFRTSHEVMKIEPVSDAVLSSMIDAKGIAEHRMRALNPDRPVLRGSAQNPDVFFQAREAINPFYLNCPAIVQSIMDQFAAKTGRAYHLFDYVGHPEAEKVIVIMGSGAETVDETVEFEVTRGRRVGVIKVRLYRPFDGEAFIRALPPTTQVVAVLDRTKEPGAVGEPLYQDVVTAMAEFADQDRSHFHSRPRVVGGRYGLSSKEFTPAMVKGVFDSLDEPRPKNHFTVGIIDDVCHTSLSYDCTFSTEPDDVVRAVFHGLGSDGTVGANKNTVKIIGEETNLFAQGYFVYDSKKAGSQTVSHLRFGPRPIRSTYLVQQANFIACHQESFLDRVDMLDQAVDGATFLLNTKAPPDRVWENLPREVREPIIQKRLKFYVIDAGAVARRAGMGNRINTIMQMCFFALSGVLPRDEAIEKIKVSIHKTYEGKGLSVVEKNFAAVDQAVANLFEVHVPQSVGNGRVRLPVLSIEAPEFVRNITGAMIAGKGDALPVSAMPIDGTFPTDTARWEKRNLAWEIPIWDPEICIQCNKCALVCPHAAIRAKVFDKPSANDAPETFRWIAARGAEYHGLAYSLQVAPEDCTGCGLCVEICPAKNKREVRLKAINMRPHADHIAPERENYRYFLDILEFDRSRLKANSVKGSQFLQPLFEYSGACAGCGETPYIKLVTQLFGDRAIIANATGCSSIYGGNLPTTPYAQNKQGRGPTWCNSLFEDNAEFGLGFRLSLDKQKEFATELLRKLADSVGLELTREVLTADQSSESGIDEQRNRIAKLKTRLIELKSPEAFNLLIVADTLVKRTVWIIGGDGWAYDIGYGGLDHVLASGRNVNVLVLDTEVYSNTGGQMSKATPCGAVAKFAAAGKPSNKKDLGRLAMSYGNVYVATVAMGANDNQTVKAFVEAESYDGPSIIIAYSHCIAHGIDMRRGLAQQQAAVNSGHFPLYRFDPRRTDQGDNPFQLDSHEPTIPVRAYAERENRYKMLMEADPRRADRLMQRAQHAAKDRYEQYAKLALGNGVEQNSAAEVQVPTADAKVNAR